MRIPFFSKRIEVTVTDKPKTTVLGLVEGTPISSSSFRKVEDKFKQFYIDRVEHNKKILDSKLTTADAWMEFVQYNIRDIPKENIPEIRIQEDPANNLEGITGVRVYLQITYAKNIKGCLNSSSRQYQIYAKEHDEAERSMNQILEDIKKFKKELEVKDVK